MDATANNWSVPESDLIAAIGEVLESERRAVIATITHVEGSAYRRPGAKMLITEDGRGVGSVTAGCLENELVELANSVLDGGEPRVETFDLTSGDDIWGLGVGCNGVITILLEPLDSAYESVVAAFEASDPIAFVTAMNDEDEIVARAACRPDGEIERIDGELSPETIDRLMPALESAIDRGTSETLALGDWRVFVDGITPPPRLLVFGHGHDVGPVVDLAKKNDFRVHVVTFRGASTAAERFPDADEITATSPARLANEVPLDEESYAVVMTHNFVDDLIALETLLESPVPYVGLLGPRKRFEEMLEDYEDEGVEFDEATLERLYTPIGLDLGGGSPYQIAHSIVAEVLAVHNDRQVRHLRDRDGSIHERLRLEAE